VLRDAGRPLSSAEIYEAIKAKGLYEFKAKDPANIVRGQLRRHCHNVKSPGARIKYFEQTADGNFRLLAQPVRAD
jgi:hypothetical protein